MGRLTGKIAIVTGAASGIGAASAKLFADEGAQVLAVDRPESAIGSIHAGNAAIAPFAADATMLSAVGCVNVVAPSPKTMRAATLGAVTAFVNQPLLGHVTLC